MPAEETAHPELGSPSLSFDFLQDLPSQQSDGSPEDNGTVANSGNQADDSKKETEGSTRTKRIACVLCRKRKLKCDGTKPSCGTCSRLGHNCAYDEVRRKSGPKRGYVKALEARLAQVETMLKTQDGSEPNEGSDAAQTQVSGPNGDAAATSTSMDTDYIFLGQDAASRNDMEPQQQYLGGQSLVDEPFSWDMLALGLEEPLPNQNILDDLTNIYFEKFHPSMPMMHRARFLAAMDLAPQMRPPICLRYAMWAIAAGVVEKYEPLEETFYQRSRKYIQSDELRGHGESIITLAHTQTWILLCMYEVKHMYFPKSWLSTGRAVRLAQMLGLHRLDGLGLDVKQCLPPPRDWTEREERRRTFWAAYMEDRCASIGTGWPMTVEERDILTNLPATEEAFQNSRPERTMSLQEATESPSADFSSFAGVCLMSTLFGRNLTHLHRPGPDDNDEDLNGAFWKRHRSMDLILLNKALALPDSLRLPQGVGDPNVIFLNMCIHTSTICLHQAAIFKADKNQIPPNIATESKVRCITAAAEIASIMRSVCHLDLATMNPFMAFCLYVAARVFIQYLKSRPSDQQILSSLYFLLSAMDALKRKNPLIESFLVQLEVDMEGTGIKGPGRQNSSNKAFSVCDDSIHCSPLLHIRETGGVQTPLEASNAPETAARTGPEILVSHNGYSNSFSIVDRSGRSPGAQNYQTAGQTKGPPDSRDWPPGIPNSSLGIPSAESERSHNSGQHQSSVEVVDMDLSPVNSADHPTPSSTSQRGVSSHTSFSPPRSVEGSMKDYPQTSHSQPSKAMSSSTLPNFSTHNVRSTAQSFFPTTIFNTEDFGNLDSNLFPPTPAMDGESTFVPPGWDFTTGMTPSGVNADTWAQIVEGMSGWEGGIPTHNEQWPPNGGN